MPSLGWAFFILIENSMRALAATALAASFFLSPLFPLAQQRERVLAFHNVAVFDGSCFIRHATVLAL
jgi:hypothetical protein